MKHPHLLTVLALASATSLGAFPWKHVDTHHRCSPPEIPLVYPVENMGADYAPPVFPDFDHLPIVRPLPDPFEFFNGKRDTSFQKWERRRNEIKAAIEKYEIGPRPDGSDCTVTASYAPPAPPNQYGTLTVVVTRDKVSPDTPGYGQSLTLSERVWLPDATVWGPGPYPALIPMTWFAFSPPPNYGSLPASVFAVRPIATVDFSHDQVAAYFNFGQPDPNPFLRLYPEFTFGAQYDASQPGNLGKYAAWTWGISRLIDGLEVAKDPDGNPIPIDVEHLAVTGCSYAGKMALYAGAFDERIALTIPQESGGGGMAAWRVSQEIQGDNEVESATRTDFSWFASPLRAFNRNNIYKLPVDHHELMAMIAPRALLATSNYSQLWLSSKAAYVAARATEQVYDQLGISDRFGFIIDTGHGHCAVPESENAPIGAFLDKFLLGLDDVDTHVRVHDYGDNVDYKRWTAWWGRGKPTLRGDWNPGNGKVVVEFEDDDCWDFNGCWFDRGLWDKHGRWDKFSPGRGHGPLFVENGVTVLAGYTLKISGRHPAATASLVGGSVQLDVLNRDGRSYTLTVPFADASYAFPANDNSWLPTSADDAAQGYQGDVVAGFGGRVTGIYFSAIGKGQPPDGSGAGTPAGPGLTTDTDPTLPIKVKFHVDTGDRRHGGEWSEAETVTNENPDL